MSRTETDSLGTIEVPDDAYWGAQTQRSLENFAIGGQRMPLAVIHALAPVSYTHLAACRDSASATGAKPQHQEHMGSITYSRRALAKVQFSKMCIRDSRSPSLSAAMNYLISLGIGLLVGALYAVLDFRSPAPPAIALVGLLGMQLGEQLFPLGRDLLQQWLH